LKLGEAVGSADTYACAASANVAVKPNTQYTARLMLKFQLPADGAIHAVVLAGEQHLSSVPMQQNGDGQWKFLYLPFNSMSQNTVVVRVCTNSNALGNIVVYVDRVEMFATNGCSSGTYDGGSLLVRSTAGQVRFRSCTAASCTDSAPVRWHGVNAVQLLWAAFGDTPGSIATTKNLLNEMKGANFRHARFAVSRYGAAELNSFQTDRATYFASEKFLSICRFQSVGITNECRLGRCVSRGEDRWHAIDSFVVVEPGIVLHRQKSRPPPDVRRGQRLLEVRVRIHNRHRYPLRQRRYDFVLVTLFIATSKHIIM
jgi:hypothetical protein